MSETELWQRMAEHLPSARLMVWADTVSMGGLDHMTVNEAIAAGVDFKRIWRAVWAFLELPPRYL